MTSGKGPRARQRRMPIRRAEPQAGVALDFPDDGAMAEIALPLPALAGMDALEIATASARLAPRGVERRTDHPAPAGGLARLRFTGGVEGAPVRLLRVEIEGFSPGTDGVPRHLAGTPLRWAAGQAAPGTGALSPQSEALHLLLGPGQGPPALAAPAFPMPGAGGALYGDALGGMLLTASGAGPVRLVLTPRGGLRLGDVALRVVRLAPGVPRLPQEGAPVAWRAAAIRAVWEVKPAALVVEASDGGRQLRVAEIAGEAGQDSTGFDFAAALRGLAPALLAGGALRLRVTARGAGAARITLGEIGARYLRHPLDRPEALRLRGAAEQRTLHGPPLRPEALDLWIEGRFRPERLALASDDTPAAPRRGLVAEGGTRLAAPLPLTPAERELPLARVALHGRAALPTELLLTLHAGEARRLGAALGPGVALQLEAEALPRWHRANLLLPAPQPPFLWLVVQAPRGRFLWHGVAGEAQHSADAGGSWVAAATRPAWQVAVREDAARPAPLVLHGPGGRIAEDVALAEGPDFRRRLLLEPPSHTALLDGLAHGPLTLGFTSARDVDLALSDATLAYDPWRGPARGRA